MTTYKAFREKLDQEHKWPAIYMFKFIVPKTKEQELETLFKDKPMQKKASKGGNYISFTMQLIMHSSEEVIEIYKEAHQIEGVIAL